MSPDTINGLFELGSGVLLFMNVARLHKDKIVRGVSIVPIAFFMVWGYWNLYFYPTMHCVLSFFGGILVVISNTIWVCQMIYYNRKERNVRQI